MKFCASCKIEKPLSDFHVRKNRISGVQSTCKDCANKNKREYRIKNKDKIRIWNKRRNPGWDIERYNQYVELQGNSCAICGTTEPGLSDWCCDHCHDTDKPRGLLCVRCNAGLGYFRDNPEYLQSAIEYLNKWQEATSHVTP
jgi:hypothetical protein